MASTVSLAAGVGHVLNEAFDSDQPVEAATEGPSFDEMPPAENLMPSGMNDSAESELKTSDEPSAVEIDCSYTGYTLPEVLKAEEAKKAVANIEFFFDDPDQLKQIEETITTSTSHEEAEQIVAGLFAARGVKINFNETPESIHFNPARIDLLLYRAQLTNFVRAYSLLPVQLGQQAAEVYYVNGLWTFNDSNQDGKRQAEELKGASGFANYDGTVLYDSNAFSSYNWGYIVVVHELSHIVDLKTCAPDFSTAKDSAINDLRSHSELTSMDTGLDPDAYAIPASQQHEASSVIARDYGRSNALEDKATIYEALSLGNFPDVSDANFDPNSLLYQKQELVNGRMAEYLGIDDLAQLYMFFDMYGINTHPKEIIRNNLSVLQAPFAKYLLDEVESGITKHALVTLADGEQVSLVYKEINNYFELPLSIEVNGDEGTDCASLPEYKDLIEFGKAVLGDAEGHNRKISVFPVIGDVSNGKIECRITIYSDPKPDVIEAPATGVPTEEITADTTPAANTTSVPPTTTITTVSK